MKKVMCNLAESIFIQRELIIECQSLMKKTLELEDVLLRYKLIYQFIHSFNNKLP